MLDFAFKYKEELNKLYLEKVVGNSYYDYWYSTDYHRSFNLDIVDSTWDLLQNVSLVNGKVVGYVSARIDRYIRKVDSLSMFNLYPEKFSFTFINDIRKFINNLFVVEQVTKINFCVHVGNPAERIYDKFIEKFGGRVVGYYEDDVLIMNKKLVNVKIYELKQSSYFDSQRK